MTENKDEDEEEGKLTFSFCGFAGSVSTGLIQATPGDMKSFNVSTDRMADILESGKLRARRAAEY